MGRWWWRRGGGLKKTNKMFAIYVKSIRDSGRGYEVAGLVLRYKRQTEKIETTGCTTRARDVLCRYCRCSAEGGRGGRPVHICFREICQKRTKGFIVFTWPSVGKNIFPRTNVMSITDFTRSQSFHNIMVLIRIIHAYI